MARRVVKLTDVSSAERVPPADEYDRIEPGLLITFEGRMWKVIDVFSHGNRVVLEDLHS